MENTKTLKLNKNIVDSIEKLANAKNNSFDNIAVCLLNFAVENLCDEDKKIIENKN